MSRSKEWIDKLAQWRESGQSGMAWCREHNIAYAVFLYWRKKLKQNQPTTIPVKQFSELFVEIKDQPLDERLVLEYQGVLIRLSTNFDPITLKRCLQILRSC